MNIVAHRSICGQPQDLVVDCGEIRRALDLFCGHHGVTEIRAIKCKGKFGAAFIAGGYFDDFELAAEKVAELDDEVQPAGIYFVFNDVNPACLSRAFNRFEHRPEKSTGDAEIVVRRWLFVDIDPTRPAGISSTDAEKESAVDVRDEIFEELRTQTESIVADSGNGWHLYIPICLPNDAESRASIESLLKGLHQRWPLVDVTTYNAARITKLYGTISRKGDSTVSRPHRPSKLVWIPDFLREGWSDK